MSILERRQKRVIEKVGKNCAVLLLDSSTILSALKEHPVIIMACNTRIKHVIPGIMRAAKECDAVVAFELAKSEGNVDGGYTGQNPYTYFETVMRYAHDVGFFYHPFFIHGDHITVKDASEKQIEEARTLIAAELDAGYTSFAIDASFNELEDNIKITAELAAPIIEAECGLEVEVGEIKATGQEGEITTVEEAHTFISELNKRGIRPDLLAIYNGAKHGNYLDGERIFIDLDRTKEIYDAVKGYGVSIAQHGITGTPLHIVGRFSDFGIRKGNVGTEWQNIAHRGLPEELFSRMKEWAKEQGKDIKFATKPFKEEIDNIPEENKRRIEEEAYQVAKQFIKAFRAVGTASLVRKALS